MWKNIEFNKQNIKADTGKAVLIAMPHSSAYDGYCFWHPAKLIRNGSNSYARTFGYTNDFTFKLKKYGQGRYNSNKVIDEREITASEMEDAFRTSSPATWQNGESYVRVDQPEIKTPKEENVADDLAL